jgi:hypothetical protein
MSLVTRMLGVGSCLLGGWMMGYGQGIQTVVDAVKNITFDVAKTMPNVGSYVAYYVGGYLQQNGNPAYASYWEFGIILAIGGFILLARGDPKPNTEKEPLLTQPLFLERQVRFESPEIGA